MSRDVGSANAVSRKVMAGKLFTLTMLLAGGWLILSHYVTANPHQLSMVEALVGGAIMLTGVAVDLIMRETES